MAESIKVIVRTRPLSYKEKDHGNQTVVQVTGPNRMVLNNKSYNFDACLGPSATQLDVYNIAGKPIVENLIDGYNGTIFAYGQTSTGKTHTMVCNPNEPEDRGLIPRMVEEIFQYIMNTTSNSTFVVKVSYLEIYMEKVRDLLDIHKDNLPLFEDAKKTTYVKGATERYVSTSEDVLDILEEGKSNRKVAVTAMNLDSSRSHCIFSLSIRNEDQKSAKTTYSRLFLVDLAGSEKVSKSAVEGQTLDEAKGINKSLSSLGNVINALTEGSGHIPYRDSKLTRILQDSLGGNSKTTMIICCSPSIANEAETKSSILFGMRAKTIKNLVSLNVELNATEWQKQYLELKKKYEELIEFYLEIEQEVVKWRKGEVVTRDNWVKLPNKEELIVKDIYASNISNKLRRSSTMICQKLVKSELYGHVLDKKEEEITSLNTELVAIRDNYEQNIEKLNNLISERDKHKELANELNSKLKLKDKDVKELLGSVEEMALNLEKSDKLLIEHREQHLKATEEITKLMIELKGLEAQMSDIKSAEMKLRSSMLEGMMNMKRDLTDIMQTVFENKDKPAESKSLNLEVEFYNLMTYITKMKNVANNSGKFERINCIGHDSETCKKTEILSKKLELTCKTYEDRISNLLLEKKEMEQEISLYKSENSHLKITNQSIIDSYCSPENMEKETNKQTTNKMHDKLNSITEKLNAELEEIKNRLENKDIEIQVLKLKLDGTIAELSTKQNCRQNPATDQQKPEKKESNCYSSFNIEEVLNRELNELQNLRSVFLSDLRMRMKKPLLRDNIFDDEDLFSSGEKLNLQQRERINFLENNLESLTKVHKQLVRDNADLRCELPKLQKRVKSTSDRAKQLEASLKDSKEMGITERKKYQSDIEKLKDSFRCKDSTIKTAIVKPIKAGCGLET